MSSGLLRFCTTIFVFHFKFKVRQFLFNVSRSSVYVPQLALSSSGTLFQAVCLALFVNHLVYKKNNVSDFSLLYHGHGLVFQKDHSCWHYVSVNLSVLAINLS